MDDQNKNNPLGNNNPPDPTTGSPVTPPVPDTTSIWPTDSVSSTSVLPTTEPTLTPPTPPSLPTEPPLPETAVNSDPNLTPPSSSLPSEPVGTLSPSPTMPDQTSPQPTGWPSSLPEESSPSPTSPPWPQPPQTIGQQPVINPSEPVAEQTAPPSTLLPPQDQSVQEGSLPIGTTPSDAGPAPEPVPTFTSPEPTAAPAPGESPLPTTTFPPADSTNLPPNPTDLNPVFNLPPTAPNFPQEPAPTDLSHLTGNDQPPPPEVYTPPVTSPENLVVPTTNSVPESIDTGNNHRGISKKLLIGGAMVILLTATASAYFILGIGRTTTPSPSPVSTQPALTNPPPPRSVSQPAVTPTPVATGPATFGNLNNPTGPQATSSASPTSALERLRSRQTPAP